jgi:putative transposase
MLFSGMAEDVNVRKQFHCVFEHLVIVTKYRRRCITREMLSRLCEITAQRCKDWNGELQEFNGEADHVHARVSLPPNLDLSIFVNNLRRLARGSCVAISDST